MNELNGRYKTEYNTIIFFYRNRVPLETLLDGKRKKNHLIFFLFTLYLMYIIVYSNAKIKACIFGSTRVSCNCYLLQTGIDTT